MKKITELKENQIFVFGSNANGNHAGGAAYQAKQQFGALEGQAKGIQGQSYAIVTLDESMQRVELSYISQQLIELNKYAQSNSDKEFLLTLIGCGIAGFEITELKPLFTVINWNKNVIIPLEFQDIKFIKGFDANLCCRDVAFEVGKTYIKDNNNPLILCSDSGYHFCESLQLVHKHYDCNPFANNRFCYIEPIGEIVSDGEKCIAKGIKISKELSKEELDLLRFTGTNNAGMFNSGDLNSGYLNSGDLNSGDLNSGDRNSGDRNSGDRNSGDLNSGDRNSGDLNSGYRNSGVFCTRSRESAVPFFNKESDMTWIEWHSHPAYHASLNLSITEWIPWDNMTDEDKTANPKAHVTKGYLKTYTYYEAWANLWKTLSCEQRNSFKTLPNYDSDVFFEVTGIIF